MDRYQTMFGEAFDKSNLRHVALEVIATGQAMLELADKQGVEASMFDVHWNLSGRYDSHAAKLRTTARLADIIGDKYVRREIEGLSFQQQMLPLAHTGGGGDLDDFPLTQAVIFRTSPLPEMSVNLIDKQQQHGSSSSSARPLPARDRTRRRTRKAKETLFS